MQFRRRVLGSELRPEPDASMWSTSRLASSLPAIHDGPLLARSFVVATRSPRKLSEGKPSNPSESANLSAI